VAVIKMKSGIGGEFCRVLTSDGLELNGFYIEPSQEPKAKSKSQKWRVLTPVPNP